MDIDLEAKARSVVALLEDELTYEKLEIPIHTLPHLSHFRTFLQSHFINVYGNWPPRAGSFSRPLYSSLQNEFDCLLRYIGDLTTTLTEERSRVLERFDAQHNYQGLHISRPLLPHLPSPVKDGQANTGSFSNISWRKAPKALSVARVRAEHIAATNQKDPQVLQSPLVQAFARFEEENAAAMHRDISYKAARRTCFVLVYCMVQTLKSITRAAPEVTESQQAAYPLCCNTSSLPSWSKGSISPAAVSPVQHQFGPSGNGSGVSSVSSRQHIAPLRTKSLSQRFGLTRPSRLTRATFRNHTASDDCMNKEIETISEPNCSTDSASENGTTTSEAPSLDWSRGSSKSVSSATDSTGRHSIVLDPKYSFHSSSPRSSYQDSLRMPDEGLHKRGDQKPSLSRSSSVYSERVAVVPQKPVSDVLDKGLADDDMFVVPGLF